MDRVEYGLLNKLTRTDFLLVNVCICRQNLELCGQPSVGCE